MLVITDLDGTLAVKDSGVSSEDRASLEILRQWGTTRVVATGRSLFGALKVLEDGFPVDYIIFSSGTGIYDCQTKEIVHQHSLSAADVKTIYSFLEPLKLDFMIQREVPSNHEFLYTPIRSGPSDDAKNPDFAERIFKSKGICWPLDSLPRSASQYLVVHPAEKPAALFDEIRKALSPQFNVVRATSPLDGKSMWIEIFHPEASKALAAEWIRQRHQISPEKTYALGNDYNDLQLLSWVKNPLVVGDAVPELLNLYSSVVSHRESALSAAIRRWFSH